MTHAVGRSTDKKTYPWKRFWCPRKGAINLSDGGFLCDPEGKYAKYISQDVVPFEKIAHLPCLALLGEPGIGKSRTMEDLRDTLGPRIKATGDKFVYLNLNEYGDESRLIRDIFESEAFTQWKDDTNTLHLFLDSLDECHTERCTVSVKELLPFLTPERQTTRGDGNWGIKVLKDRPDELAFEPPTGSDDWLFMSVTWLEEENDD